jgi:hypothetical protein
MMKLNRLVNLILEESVEEYETWDDYLDWESDLEKSDLLAMKEKFGCTITSKLNGKILEVTDGNKTMWLEWDGDTANIWANDIDDVNSNLYRMSEGDLFEMAGISEDELYVDGWESTIGDAKEYPGTVYHYTTEEKWEEIQEDGGLKPSYGSGLTNRHASGVFTSIDPEEHAMGTYGNVCLAIDLQKFKTENNLKTLDIFPEPEVMETALQNTIKHKLGIENKDSEASQDMSTYTMIVNHYIPIEYVSVIGSAV